MALWHCVWLCGTVCGSVALCVALWRAQLVPNCGHTLRARASTRAEWASRDARTNACRDALTPLHVLEKATRLDLYHTQCTRNSEKSAQMQWRVRAL